MKVLVFGNGWLGNKVHEYFKNSCLSDARIINEISVYRELYKFCPNVVINCIGKTGNPNIDWCEYNKISTLESNLMVPLYIQEACKNRNIKMVHIGTGCIYQGNSFYNEESIPNFTVGTYAKSKYLAEQFLDKNVLQLRIRMPIDNFHNKRNLLSKLIQYDKTINELNSITIIPDFLKAMEYLINIDAKGIFNIVNDGPITHSEILEIYNKYSMVKKNIKEITIDDLKNIVIAERSNCTLSTEKLNKVGFVMKDTKESLNECIKEYLKELPKQELQFAS